ncbi:MAG TPA: alpha-amylase family glycosyl hydrolase [Pseudogracilibacillus sp.]|nr:alpha-amylase family glycosyl hydrolase [Pseudogracilibacillus sp.]
MKRLVAITIISALMFFTLQPSSAPRANLQERTLQDEIIYDILVDRFNNGRQAPSEQVDLNDPYAYYGGDIYGVTKMLDSLMEHGFTTVSLSPIMENAPKGYHGYWIEDFYAIEEEFGTIEDVRELVEEAHERDMKVMLELVINYVAKSSPLVEEHPDWFEEVTAEPTDSTYWLEDVYQFDHENEDVQQFLLDVATFWQEEAGVDGFVLHAADESDPLFVERLVHEVKEADPTFYVIATSLQGDGDLSAIHAIEEIDAVANEELFQALNDVLIKPDEPISILVEKSEQLADHRYVNYVDNMNVARFSNNFAEQGRNMETTWKLALSYLYLMPGVPIVYQGSEVPMYGPGFPANQMFVDFVSANPDLKKVYERTAALRKQFPSFVHGDFEVVAENEGMSLIKRSYDGETVYLAMNNDAHSRTVTIGGIDDSMQLKGILHDDTVRANEDGEFLIGMERESVEVFIIQPNVGFNWGFISFVGIVFIVFIGFIVYLSRKQKKREAANK